jgi:outer membrane autotransporter protein
MQCIPFASLHYCFVHQNHFDEKGADGLNLKVEETNANLLRSECGLKVSYCHRINDYEWVPHLAACVIQENRFKGKYYRTEFLQNPGVFFTVKGIRPNRTLFSSSADIVLKKGERLSWSLEYDGEFGRKFQNNRIDLSMNYSF